MTTLSELRTALAACMSDAGLPVSETLPGRFTPPIAVLVPGSPYIDEADTYGAFTVRHDVVVISGIGDNESVTKRLDELIANTVGAVTDSHEFYLESAAQPALYTHNQQDYLACVISVYAREPLEG